MGGRAMPGTLSPIRLAKARLPKLEGRPVLVRLRSSLGPHLAATSIPKRLILLDSEVLAPPEFERILVHEIFHFAWVRLSNAVRRDWEQTLVREFRQHAIGELGWSAERRKNKLTSSHVRDRARPWRLYACESFCDTAAWRFANVPQHQEFTLAARFCRLRRAWFERHIESRTVLI
jgi:hypothetical protein